MHKLKTPDLWKWDECLFCKDCTPDAEDTGQRSPSCDRCQMFGTKPDRFKPNFVTPREVALEKALSVLCELKSHKNQHGKTALYEEAKPKAWERARELIKQD